MDIGSVIESLSPNVIYDGGKSLAQFIATFVTPFLLALAIGIRTLETQVDTMVQGRGKWGGFIKDMGIWITVLAVYFALVMLISDVFNALYNTFSSAGSLSGLMAKFNALMEGISNNAGEGAAATFTNIFASPVYLLAWGVNFLSLLLLAFVAIFLQFAHALAYAMAISWGLIAIPMSITTSFKLLAGWGKYTGIMLVWPIIHYIAFAIFTPLFVNATGNFSMGIDGAVTLDKTGLYFVLTVINLVACAIMIAAPFVAQALVNNSGAITGVVAPFAAAGMGAASVVSRFYKDRFVGAGRSAVEGLRSSANQGVINQGLQTIAHSIGVRAGGAPVPATGTAGFSPRPVAITPSGGTTHSPSAVVPPPSTPDKTSPRVSPANMVTASAAGSDAASTTASESRVTGERKSAKPTQQRRGAIINQQRKAKQT
ncbi:MAG: hypothetical protein FD165_2673 [Gammaproteobacteria bacterium]|nr:MAG: hypothetical protein FD165_2673 [Gammaproteobacteria bacterium]TND01146.1 MAG: hypothetical protein FD120_2682 [Gammaproteobacteria bacterium]